MSDGILGTPDASLRTAKTPYAASYRPTYIILSSQVSP
jgi:hypothetical protein